MPAFDVVSEIDLHQFSNACDQANRMLDTRFDFRGVDAKFERKDLTVTLFADVEFQLQQMIDMLQSCLTKCKIDILAMDIQDHVGAGKQVKQLVTLQNGLETPEAKKITKLIKESKLKVTTQIQDQKVRVTGKKRDDLQQAMALLRAAKLEQPVQFNNFRD